MKIIKNITPTTRTVFQLKSMFDNEEIFIDNSYQRRYVWEEKHKIGLIETILLGYDIPAIYLWQQEPDPKTGKIRYSIVDGQQRVGAIISYLNNEFPLTKKHLLSTNDAPWDNKKFCDLPDENKKDIWSYAININDLNNEITPEEITTMFLRLNITNKVLNPQELRNAQFNGKFIQLSIELAELDFWNKYKVFSSADVRRMKDVEFVSHLLIFLRKGMKIATSQSTVNKMYDLYNESYSEYKEDKETVILMLDEMKRVIENLDPKIINQITKITHLYTLFVVSYALKAENYYQAKKEDVINVICEFYQMYFSNDYSNEFVRNYLLYSQDAVASVNNRLERYNSIINFIKQKLNIC